MTLTQALSLAPRILIGDRRAARLLPQVRDTLARAGYCFSCAMGGRQARLADWGDETLDCCECGEVYTAPPAGPKPADMANLGGLFAGL